jgi:hypothetical protein
MNRPGAGADAVMEATIAGVARAESDTDIGCGRVKTGAAPCRERLRGCDGAHLRGTGPVFRPNGPCDAVTMKVERFFHDVSRYGGGPVTPSKISMMIICP